MASAVPAGSTIRVGLISIFGGHAGMKAKNPWTGRSGILRFHPNQHIEAELKIIRDMCCGNPQLDLVELWYRLKQRGYTRRLESLFQYTAIDEFSKLR